MQKIKKHVDDGQYAFYGRKMNTDKRVNSTKSQEAMKGPAILGSLSDIFPSLDSRIYRKAILQRRIISPAYQKTTLFAIAFKV